MEVIFICEYCNTLPCPPPCPSFSGYGGGREGEGMGMDMEICALCGVRLYESDPLFRVGTACVCPDCADELVSPDLLDLLSCPSLTEFFDLLR